MLLSDRRVRHRATRAAGPAPVCLVFGVAALLFAVVVAADEARAGSVAARGRQTFVRAGCSECHGTEGQGGAAGRNLVRSVLPLPALIAFVRAASGPMPSYTELVLTDAELADIRAYLASIPRPAMPASIPALRDLKDSN